MSDILGHFVCFIQAIGLTIASVLILALPSFIYLYAGGTNSDVEFGCRALGFLIWLCILQYLVNRK